MFFMNLHRHAVLQFQWTWYSAATLYKHAGFSAYRHISNAEGGMSYDIPPSVRDEASFHFARVSHDSSHEFCAMKNKRFRAPCLFLITAFDQ